MTKLSHYETTLQLFRDTQDKALEFGHSALVDIVEGKTIRQMSIDLCGNAGLEDKIGRWIQAAEWDNKIKARNGRLYEDAREWLSPSHFTILEKIYLAYDDFAHASDLMEQCLVRNSRTKEVIEVQPVEWLRGKLQDPGTPSTAVLYHRLWKTAARALADAQSELARAGNYATSTDRRRIRILSLVVRFFNAVDQV